MNKKRIPPHARRAWLEALQRLAERGKKNCPGRTSAPGIRREEKIMVTNLSDISAYKGGDIQDNQGWTLTILEPPTMGVRLSNGVDQVQITCLPPENPSELQEVLIGLYKVSAVESPCETTSIRWLREFE